MVVPYQAGFRLGLRDTQGWEKELFIIRVALSNLVPEMAAFSTLPRWMPYSLSPPKNKLKDETVTSIQQGVIGISATNCPYEREHAVQFSTLFAMRIATLLGTLQAGLPKSAPFRAGKPGSLSFSMVPVWGSTRNPQRPNISHHLAGEQGMRE